MYRRLSDHGRRLLNQAMFEELLIDHEDITIRVVGQTGTEPVRDLAVATNAYREPIASQGQLRTNRPAANGEPAREPWRTCSPSFLWTGVGVGPPWWS